MDGAMSFTEKNTIASLVNFSLILIFYLVRMFQMFQNDTFEPSNVFRLWGIVIFLAVVVTIGAIIFTHIASATFTFWKTGEKEEIDNLEDERDKLINLRGTQATYMVSSFGSLLAMLTFVLGEPPLVMFSLLIFLGIFAQIVGDVTRLMLYRGGF